MITPAEYKPAIIAASCINTAVFMGLLVWCVRFWASRLPTSAQHAAYRRIALAGLVGGLLGMLLWGATALVR
ncbi:MAG: hypothetical protein GX446_13110 [Chthonomonadales bacterium]|nr:hypothetical protein [Chthonomonadales bacterium]